MVYYYQTIVEELGINIWLFLLLVVWSVSWKGVALWKSARNNHLRWFVALMILTTMGILEIIYIFVFSETKKQKPVKIPVKKKIRRRR